MNKKHLLVRLREEAGYKTKKITNMLCMSRTTLYLIERNKRSMDILEAEGFCKLYDITLEDLENEYTIERRTLH